MISDFEEWKRKVLNHYNLFMHGNDEDGAHAICFCNLIDSLEYSATESEADFLFSLFTNEEDYEVLETVVQQLWGMKDKRLFAKCLLKAFPNLINNANKWAEDFLYCLEQKNEVLQIVSKLENKNYIISYAEELEQNLLTDLSNNQISLSFEQSNIHRLRKLLAVLKNEQLI